MRGSASPGGTCPTRAPSPGGAGGGTGATHEPSSAEKPDQTPDADGPPEGTPAPVRAAASLARCASRRRTSALAGRPFAFAPIRRTPPGGGPAAEGGEKSAPEPQPPAPAVCQGSARSKRPEAVPAGAQPPQPAAAGAAEPKSSGTPAGRAPWNTGPGKPSPPQSPHDSSSSSSLVEKGSGTPCCTTCGGRSTPTPKLPNATASAPPFGVCRFP